jgi:hypothetical protein
MKIKIVGIILFCFSMTTATTAPTPSVFTQAQITSILAQHNLYRQNPAPLIAPANLPPLTWDPNVAAMAQSWVNTCSASHNPAINNYPYYGENIAGGSYSGNVAAAVQAWFAESNNIVNPNQPIVFSAINQAWCNGNWQNCGHVTQVLWQGTTSIGCGMANCIYQGSQMTFIVCDYYPKGNLEGSVVYTVASPPTGVTAPVTPVVAAPSSSSQCPVCPAQTVCPVCPVAPACPTCPVCAVCKCCSC